MPINYTIQKSKQLGKSYNNARALLIKNILWDLLVKTNQTVCFRCGHAMTNDNYTIDHKLQWLGVSNDLFWDLDNISFSHHKCNSGAHRVHRKTRVSV
jgi:hypothetical protein